MALALAIWVLGGSPLEARPVRFSEAPDGVIYRDAEALRKATHQAVTKATDDIEKLHFNVCVAAI